MCITEWMYSGDSGEFIEFTNLSDVAVDMTDWSMDDNGATRAFDLSAFGVIQPGESVIVTEAAEAAFRPRGHSGPGSRSSVNSVSSPAATSDGTTRFISTTLPGSSRIA